MKTEKQTRGGGNCLFALLSILGMSGSHAIASEFDTTLIMMGDLHATLVPHAAEMKKNDDTVYYATQAGGLAKLKALVDGIREENPENLLLSCGDLTHGSAEALFTVGDAMIKAMNLFDIDVFTPGNWDFGYGPAVFRNRFASFGPKPNIPPWTAVMAGYVDCSGLDPEDCTEEKGIIQAKFPSVAINLYNSAPIPEPLQGKRVLDPYLMFERGGITIAVIGITAAIVPQQADVFNIGLRFTQGVEELPEILAEVKDKGADLIVVQSELGLSQNIEIARSFKDIDVMYSAHTHEITMGALLADRDAVTRTTPGLPLSGAEQSRLARGAAIVVETNRDMYVGQLDVRVADGKVIDFEWTAHPVDDTVTTVDTDMEALVAEIEDGFVDGGNGVVTHVFLPGAFCTPGCGDTSGDDVANQRGHYLTEDLNTVVGYTDTLLLRHNVLEDTLNNWLADAIRAETDMVFPGGVDISMSNGFRFGNAVLPGSAITLRDLYTWFPVGPAVNVAEFAGQTIEAGLEEILGAVFNRNPFLQRGGWYLGLANMTQMIDLDNRPFSSSSGRIVSTSIGGAQLDSSKRYVFASCYAHGDAIDKVCRTGGGSDHMFFELADATDYTSTISVVSPVNPPAPFPPTGPVKRVAPYKYVHPVHLLRRQLDGATLDGEPENEVTETDYGVGRIKTVDSTKQVGGVYPEVDPPVPEPDPTLVQPPQGAGPLFFSGKIGE
jgi:2',3'-cyclic-nucleotide 2'-phosphodiesterase (5'-nucleotidase family)